MAESTKLYRIPGAGDPEHGIPERRVPYDKYRNETGRCETCGQSMLTHKKCEACGILCGSGHWDSQEQFRGQKLCEKCIHSWQAVEAITRRPVDFDKFCHPNGRVKEEGEQS